MTDRYEELEAISNDELRAMLKRGDPAELAKGVVRAALHLADFEFAQQLCQKLSNHSDSTVRGNAVLGFGHLARRFRRLDEASVPPIIEAAIKDESDYVRGQACAAADDLIHFLGWRIRGIRACHEPRPERRPLIPIESVAEFEDALSRPAMVLFIWVNWSGQARDSERRFQSAYDRWCAIRSDEVVPAYRLDVSEQSGELWDHLANWLSRHVQREQVHTLMIGGVGSLLCWRDSAIVDVLLYAGGVAKESDIDLRFDAAFGASA